MPEETNTVTVEELALMIQDGREDLYGELWERVEKFVRYMAGRYWNYVSTNGHPTFEKDDLVQSGFFGLVKAVKYYRPERGFAFLTILGTTLKTEFANVAGFRRGQSDALRYSVSLESTTAAEDDDLTLSDMISDPDAEAAITSISDCAGMRYTTIVCREALHSLEPQERAYLYARHYLDMTAKDASEVAGVSLSTGKSFDLTLPAKLRCGRYGWKLRLCWELIGQTGGEYDPLTIAYSGGGGRFKTTFTSPTEAAALAIIEKEAEHE